ncbi:MAG: carbohydrate ABC transporter permease, partial [Lactobacillus iners]|nr:carbohydrate ABC transporter permease [Lactobacillus iners]
MKKIKTILIYIFVTFFAIITVFPFIYMIFGGLMTYEETTRIPPTFV